MIQPMDQVVGQVGVDPGAAAIAAILAILLLIGLVTLGLAFFAATLWGFLNRSRTLGKMALAIASLGTVSVIAFILFLFQRTG